MGARRATPKPTQSTPNHPGSATPIAPRGGVGGSAVKTCRSLRPKPERCHLPNYQPPLVQQVDQMQLETLDAILRVRVTLMAHSYDLEEKGWNGRSGPCLSPSSP